MATTILEQPVSLTSAPFAPAATTANHQAKQHPQLSGDVVTTLNYYKDPGDGSLPPPNYVNKPETYDRPVEPRSVTVHDLRGKEGEFTLDKSGFQIVKRETAEKDFLDDEHIKDVYYKDVERLLKDVTGASRVFIFDHTIRRGEKDSRTTTPAGNPLRGPVQRVHIDQSYKAGPQRVEHHLGDDAPRLLRSRYQIINVWRPIAPIERDPLAVAEAGSVPDSDLVPVQLIYPDRVGETYTVRPNPAHRFWSLGGQRPDEVLLIKCFDSKLDGRARRVPHTAFVDPRAAPDAKPRQSIEVRVLVFHEDETAE